MRHLALISVLASLIAGCGVAGPSPSAPASSPVQTALPTPTATPVVTPSLTPTPTPSPSIVAGWPKVSRGGVTMTGIDLWEQMMTYGNVVIRVKGSGLAPGEVVSLSGTGTYDSELRCGPLPSGCREISYAVEAGKPACIPAHEKDATGRFAISEQATADANGTAVATLRFVIPETEDACPVGKRRPSPCSVTRPSQISCRV